MAHRSYYGVFDGHGGYLASQYCVDRLSLYIKDEPEFPDGDIGAAMHDSYMKIDDDFIASGKPDGTTVCTCIVVGGKKVYCANTGDSRARRHTTAQNYTQRGFVAIGAVCTCA